MGSDEKPGAEHLALHTRESQVLLDRLEKHAEDYPRLAELQHWQRARLQETYADLKRLTKAAFNQRRKTLRNSLRAGGFAIDGIDEATLKLRPEQLSPENFVDLTRQLTAQ